MQDLTKPIEVNNNPLSLVKDDKWLTKDRLWNFVFWFVMPAGLTVAHFMRTNLQIKDVATFMYISTFLGIPLLLIIFNRTRFIEKDTFANSEGNILTKEQMPYAFPLAIIAGIAFSVLISVIFLPKNTNSLFVAFSLSISVFSGLSLYFIFKNCPISILFNKNAFKPFSAAELVRINKISTSRSTTSFSPPDYICDIKYRFMSSNIHNHNRYRR